MKKPLALSLLLLLFGLFLFSSPLAAAPTHLFKIASIAPEGSVWATRFNDFAKEAEEKTDGKVGFKIYPGGVMGDDRAMYRKIRIGQLHGGGFTMTGIGGVVPDFRVMGIPFLFASYGEVDAVMQGLYPLFAQSFADQGLELIAMTEVGFVYAMSRASISTLEQFKQGKIWAPEGDPISIAYLETLGISPLPLAVPDVLTSLQTGMIDTVFNSLYGTIVLQWFTKARYISDMPFAYAYGCLLFDRKKFSRLPDPFKTVIKESAAKHFSLLMEDTRKSNSDSRQVLLDSGVTMVVPDPKSVKELRSMRDKTVENLLGKSFSKEIYTTTQNLLNDYRKQEKQTP